MVRPPEDMDPKTKRLIYMLVVYGAPIFLFIAFYVALPMAGLSLQMALGAAAVVAGADFLLLRYIFSGYRK